MIKIIKLEKEFKLNYTTIISLVFTLAGLITSIYFYYQSVSFREPFFVINPVRTVIVDSQHVNNSKIKIIDSQGKLINNPVVAVQLYFWNAGNQSIKKENILDDLIINIDNNQIRILDYKILKTSRKITNFNLLKVSNDKLKIDFDILEKNDGATCQIIYAGDPEAKIYVTGIIEGAKPIKNNKHIYLNNYKTYFIFTILFFLILIIGAVILIKGIQSINQKSKRMANIVPVFIAIVFVLIISFLVFKNINIEISEFASEQIINQIPKTLIVK